MKFKELREFIYSDLILVIDKEKIFWNVSLSELDNRYDDYEVIGVRSDYYDHISYVVVSLSQPLYKSEELIDLGPDKPERWSTLYECK